MKIEKQLTDSRCRYFYTLSINDIITFQGYLLHEEAWLWLKTNTSSKSSIECNKSNISEKSSSIKGNQNE